MDNVDSIVYPNDGTIHLLVTPTELVAVTVGDSQVDAADACFYVAATDPSIRSFDSGLDSSTSWAGTLSLNGGCRSVACLSMGG